MALLKKLSLNILSIAISLIFLFGLFVFYIFKAELKPVIQEINLSESIAIPNILLTHNTFHEVESGENMKFCVFHFFKSSNRVRYYSGLSILIYVHPPKSSEIFEPEKNLFFR